MEYNEIAAKKRQRRENKVVVALVRRYHLVLWVFLAVKAGWAGPVEMSRQVISLPTNSSDTLFVDLDGNGLSDLLVMDPVGNKLLHFHQRRDGFSNSPDQVISLPPQTAWVALCEVEAHQGLELLMSTASGLVYSRQIAGLFESERRTLIEASQVFTNGDAPILTSLSTNIPVISTGQAVLYHRDSAYQWSPEPPLTRVVKKNVWDFNDDLWTMGPHAAHGLVVEEWFRAKPFLKQDKAPESEAIRKIMDDMKKSNNGFAPIMERVDVNGDGREDVVLWQDIIGGLGIQTDIYIFLRGADQQLPARPTQVLHSRGFPVSFGSEHVLSPVHDLKGDGISELVLLEFSVNIATASGLVETALTGGLDSSLTIRSIHDGVFSANPEASVPVKIILADWGEFGSYPICIQGDFNGDGRPDLMVRRSETQWNIYVSTNDGSWFARQPAMTFDAPARGHYELQDLNGDGLTDIIWHEKEEHRLSIFMSPAGPAKGKKP